MDSRQVDNYIIQGVLGSGGMATVYRALDTRLRREVALKVLHDHISSREENRIRFEREAQAVAKLQHPNILQVYGFSTPQSQVQYIATELIDGSTLRDLVETRLPRVPETGLMLVRPIAAALAHAHASGVIHRDLKPENIMVSKAGVPKLMDFGLARILDGQKLTHTGAILGSPAHMSPELIEGQPIDHRADIFAFGTILYFVITGHLPFDGRNPAVILNAVLAGKYTPPDRLNDRVSQEITAIIRRCLARDPAQRYESVDLLLRDIDEVLRRSGFANVTLPEFFLDPDGFESAATGRLTEILRQRAQVHVKLGQLAAAMRICDRLLAFVPDDAQTLELLSRMRRRSKRRELLVTVAITLAVLAASGSALIYGRHQQQQARTQAAELAQTTGRNTALLLQRIVARWNMEEGARQQVLRETVTESMLRVQGSLQRSLEQATSKEQGRSLGAGTLVRAVDLAEASPSTPTSTEAVTEVRSAASEAVNVIPDNPATVPLPTSEEVSTAAITTHVSFRIFPPGAQVRIDGTGYGQAVTLNRSGIDLPAGEHELVANLEGLPDAQVRQSFRVVEGRPTTVTLRVPLPVARLIVGSDAPASVFIEDEYVGDTNQPISWPFTGYSTSDEVRVRVVRSDRAGAAFEQRVELTPGSRVTITAPF
ncbi:MAG: serine/threonine protein kinase [Myxococcales bacterium]|nr:serine/threonine protein kinase [Myxococcales bacterium]